MRLWALLFSLLPVLLLTGGCEVEPDVLRVGLPHTSASLVTEYVIKEKMGHPPLITVPLMPYTLSDCCTASTQWALSSGSLDLAVMCPDAARALLERDSEYEMVGPVMMNSDVIITKSARPSGVLEVAVSLKRSYQERMLLTRFKGKARPVPMLHAAVPFAYSRGVIQGAVLDILQAVTLPGRLLPAPLGTEDVVTHVLVVHRKIRRREAFRAFIRLYGEALEEIRDNDKLFKLLRGYGYPDFSREDLKTWKEQNVSFLHPLDSRRRG